MFASGYYSCEDGNPFKEFHEFDVVQIYRLLFNSFHVHLKYEEYDNNEESRSGHEIGDSGLQLRFFA